MPISVQKHSLKTCRDAIVFAEITQVNIVLLHSLRKSRGVRINLPYLYAFVIPQKSSIRIVERVFLLTLVVSALPDKFLPCLFLCFFFRHLHPPQPPASKASEYWSRSIVLDSSTFWALATRGSSYCAASTVDNGHRKLCLSRSLILYPKRESGFCRSPAFIQ